MLLLHPSRQIAIVVVNDLQLGIPEGTKPGMSFLVKKEIAPNLLVNKKPATEFLGQHFFVAGLYSNSPVMLSNNHVKKNPFLKHDVHYWSVAKLMLNKTELSKGNKLKISKKVWKRVSGDKELRAKQREKVRAALKQENGPALANCWQVPIKSKVVSLFGSPRYLPNGKGYYHSGVDLRGWTGTPVQAPSYARVVLAEHMVVPGNNIILSHGGGIYSRYMHLSEFNVAVGDVVEPGQIIGKTGATGRVEAAHLHWEVFWKSQHADPHEFINVWNQGLNCSHQ